MNDYGIVNDGLALNAVADSLENNVYISLKMKRAVPATQSSAARPGAFFLNQNMGSLLHTIKKLNADGLADAIDYSKQALRWIVDAGRAAVIDVIAEKDDDNENQCNIEVHVTKTNGKPVTYKTFFQVV
jgi:phage gp46-like protein